MQTGEGPAGWLDAARCARCHGAAHEAWAGSRHAASFSNPTFRASLVGARMAGWCLNCHAPLPEQQDAVRAGALDDPLLAQGVNCATCHVRDGLILTATPPSALARLAHPSRHAPALGEAAFCGGCHQFDAPAIDADGAVARYQAGDPLQATLDEWRRSDAAADGETCQSCHMPDGAHSFPGGRDPETLASALSVEIWRDEAGSAWLRAATTDAAGHALPTGDPFRRVELRACADPGCEQVLGRHVLARTHTFDGETWRLARDTSLDPPGGDRPSAFTWRLPDGAARWEATMWFASPRDEPHLAPDEARALIAAGEIAQ